MNTEFFSEYLDIILTKSVKIKDMTFNLKIANDHQSIEHGLMNVKRMDNNNGMIFLFRHPNILSFWMKNTLIPLDIIFIDEKGVVDSFYSMNVEHPRKENESICEYEKRLPKYKSNKKCIAAIEINFGLCKKLNLKIGEKLNIF